MKSRLKSSLKEVMAQIKQADGVLKDLKDKVAHIDKQAARATFGALKEEGVKEAAKIKGLMEEKLVVLTKELAEASVKMKSESDKLRTRVDQGLKVVKDQIKTLAEKERTKRRKA